MGGPSDTMAGVVEPLRLRVLADAGSLRTVRRSLRSWLAELGAERVGDEQIDDVVLAVHEAVANALEHAGLPATDVISVEAEVVDHTLRVTVRDHGSWRAQRPDETRGRGFVIMRAVMDHVDLASDDDSTRVVMSRRLR